MFEYFIDFNLKIFLFFTCCGVFVAKYLPISLFVDNFYFCKQLYLATFLCPEFK